MQASLQVKQLIFRLLQRDPKKRLGCFEGANEVKKHSFFKGINWALIRCTVSSHFLFTWYRRNIFCFTCERRKTIILWVYFDLQNAPELETPIFSGEAENGEKVVDPELEDLQTNVFWNLNYMFLVFSLPISRIVWNSLLFKNLGFCFLFYHYLYLLYCQSFLVICVIFLRTVLSVNNIIKFCIYFCLLYILINLLTLKNKI